MDKLKNNRKLMIIAIFAVIAVVIIIADIFLMNKDSNTEEPVNTATPTQAPTKEMLTYESAAGPTVTPEPTIPAGMIPSPLTGEYIDEKLAAKRPYAVMYNNLSVASPQSGISGADILYECVTEGGITRLMGIFQEITSDRVGSLRSARHYYVSFAKEWDAIYIHCGGSDKAYDYISSLGVDDLDAIKGIGGTLMYRDNSIQAPHNAFTSADRVNKSMEIMKYRTDSQAKKNNHFSFSEDDYVDEDGVKAGYVSIYFSYYTTPYLIYNEKNGLYSRYQFGAKHTDKNTGKTLTFKNIIIMEVDEWTMDKQGRQDMAISNNSGDGWYITNGRATKIKWNKNESKNTMRFTDSEGNLLSVNKGKTYIAVLPSDRAGDLVFKESAK